MARTLILGDRDPFSPFGTVDQLAGTAGDDLISAGHQNDFVDGGPGNDILAGGGENDVVRGGEGNDVIDDVPSNSGFIPHKSFDSVFGDSGDDVLIFGGVAGLQMEGGDGADTFRILPGNPGTPTIADFTPGIDRVEIYADANGSGILSPQDVLSHLVAIEGGTELRYDLGIPSAFFGNGLRFSGITPEQLSASDFRILEKNPHAAEGVTLRVSADPSEGDPQFQLVVDGVRLGEVQSVTADHSRGEWQEITVPGDFTFTDGAHFVEVGFLGAAHDGAPEGEGSVLYVDWVRANGQIFEGEAAANDAANGLGGLDTDAAVMARPGTAVFYTQDFGSGGADEVTANTASGIHPSESDLVPF